MQRTSLTHTDIRRSIVIKLHERRALNPGLKFTEFGGKARQYSPPQPPVYETQLQSTVVTLTSNSLICTGQMRSAAATFHTTEAQTEVTACYCVYTLLSLWS